MPCSGQLLHVHEPRTMNSLAADNLLAHSRTRAATLAIWLNKMPSTQKPADAEGKLGQAQRHRRVVQYLRKRASYATIGVTHSGTSTGRLAQRERRCLTSIGSGVQIPHRPPFERIMAARLSSHFLFLHYLKLRYQFNFNAFARVAMHHNLHYKSHHAAHKHYFSSSVFSLSLPQAHTEGGKPCQMSN